MNRYKIVKEHVDNGSQLNFFAIYKRNLWFFWYYIGYATTLEGAEQIVYAKEHPLPTWYYDPRKKKWTEQ